MRDDRWEYGGDFAALRPGELAAEDPSHPSLPEGARLFGSGRAALLALFEAGRRERGWRRILLPSYLCREIPAALEAARVPFVRYPDSPDLRPAGLPDRCEPGDVLFRWNAFGWRGVEEVDRAPEG